MRRFNTVSRNARRARRAAWCAMIALSLVMAARPTATLAAEPASAPPDADMEKMMAMAAPGAGHKALAAYVGNWKTTIQMWMGPGEPQVSHGTVSMEMVLGGRYVKSHHTGEFGGMPFEGMGIDGFDNNKGEYFSLWFDNMGTGVMMLRGKMGADGKTVTMSGTSFDPMQGHEVKTKTVTVLNSPTHYTFTMFMDMPGPDGKPTETRVMEIKGEKS